ncbi:hypothetical protein [Magnetospirillum molischianum]|uniref:Uncharacterized protein n=1 Tax=Magnetospirillum molischianum DSM 120 TaxID=1150626 RepID=H8FY02_MAGML|nr:hypothetical protein [Magnetospirillum molischianum]CCG43240.1 hypothetical protein PHAMO_80031 [Magnetospirillum molischianum DSM 120]
MAMNDLTWLDRRIAEQAAYYGLAVERFIKTSSDLAEAQEIAEATGEFAFDLPPAQPQVSP